ncbi:hypothetical protein ACV0UB_004288 [Escherichia coli]|uniref:hypothetical protein n=1 Tax=Escherichia coli TaxID=562 RepID=UPI001BFDB042|nr:hypothetical protein [Escherichia coli]
MNKLVSDGSVKKTTGEERTVSKTLHADSNMLSDEQLNMWEKQVQHIKKGGALISFEREKRRKSWLLNKDLSSPRHSLATLTASGMACLWLFAGKGIPAAPFIAAGSALLVYFMVLHFSGLPVNDEERLRKMLAGGCFPKESHFSALCLRTDSTAEDITRAVNEAVTADLQLIENIRESLQYRQEKHDE